MDLTNASYSRLMLGLEILLKGKSITYKGQLLSIREHELICTSYSDWVPRNVTQKMAKNAINSSKECLSSFIDQNHETCSQLSKFEVIYLHCYSDGKSGVLLAKESANKFFWLQEQ